MNDKKLIQEIEQLATSGKPDRLLETTVATLNEELYEAAVDAFGGWDAALAATLCESVSSAENKTSTAKTDGDESAVQRRITTASKEPIFATTADGGLFELPGLNLEVTQRPQHFDAPPQSGPVTHLYHVGEPEGLVVFTNKGRYFALQPHRVPKHSGKNAVRRPEAMLNLGEEEIVEFIVPRRALFGGRVVHVTENGKGKASASDDYMYALDREGRTAFYLDDGDSPLAVFVADEKEGIFCASAHGRGIHFPSSELRTMGQKAKGVKMIKLQNESDAVVGAFPTARVRNVAMVTEAGYGKRVEFDEFRQQGRAGQGMQLARLNRGDYVASAAACKPGGDLVVTTSRGRVHRRPATDFPMMGRPAKGNRVIELADSESIVELTALPCGSQ